MSATDELRRLPDERGVEWMPVTWNPQRETFYRAANGVGFCADEYTDGVRIHTDATITPEQAIAATLGQEPCVNPTWERWHKSLRHGEIKSIGDAVEQLMYEAIEFGGDMGPNGNTYNGIDEGDVLTAGFINEWVARFETTLDAVTLQAENATLRELVRIAGTYCVNGYCDPGDGCPLLVDGKCQLTDRMRELGVEA